MRKPYLFPIASAMIALPALCAPATAAAQAHAHPAMGSVDFSVSCDPAVEQDFNRAVALLHHMQYVESRATFESISEADPYCAMAHWGIAMTLFHPLWPDRPSDDILTRGWNAVQKAKGLGPGTARERALLAATEGLYREPESADYWTRIARWAEGMEAAYARNPDDIETATFYALSHLAAGLTADNRLEYQARAAEVLLGVYARQPMHPGAVHYTIHADDVEGRAEASIDVVRSYDDIAPQVPHALHMPTHIFIRLGEWPETIMWNRRSADAALEFPAGDAVSYHHAHALDYLVYAYLQRGEDARARAVVEEAAGYASRYQAGFISAFHLAAMPARYAVERQAWDEAAALDARANEAIDWDQFHWAESLTWFARGLGALGTGDLESASSAAARMAELRDGAKAGGEDGFATYIEIDRRILASKLAAAEGREAEAIELARSAGELEATIQKHPVTPGALLPPLEALGDLLLEAGSAADALTAYETSLGRWPARFNSVLGAARAASAAGEEETARRYYERLLEIVGEGDSTRPALVEAREYVAMGR